MSAGIQDELHTFATRLLERRGGLVEWPSATVDGTAVVPSDVAASLHAEDEMIRLSCETGNSDLCVSLATDFLDMAGRLLEAEPRIGTFRLPSLYLKRGKIEDAVSRAFTWLNAKVKVGEAKPTPVEYHTWWFHAQVVSEDRWETRFSTTISSSSGAEVDFPDPLSLWERQPHPTALQQTPITYAQAVCCGQARLRVLVDDFTGRMDSRLERDRKRLREYYNALLRETEQKRVCGNAKSDSENIEAKKRAMHLELRRKLGELDERYAMHASLRPIVLIRTEIPTLAVELAVFRKRAQRGHTVYWNPLSKQFDPICCHQCGGGAFSLAFTNDDVQPLCPRCAA
jgi:hypothetical protein